MPSVQAARAALEAGDRVAQGQTPMAQGIPAPEGRTLFGVAAALVTLAIWTSWIVGTRAAVSGEGYFSPSVLVLIRFGFTAVLLTPVLWRMGLIPKGVKWPALVGLLFSGSPYIFLVGAGLKYAPIADVGPLLPGTVPLMVAGLSALIFGERFTLARRFGLGLIAAGVVAIVAIGPAPLPGMEDKLLLGHLLILGGALSWAIYTISLRASGLNGFEATAYVAFWSLVLALPVMAPGLREDLARAAQAPLSLWLVQILIQGALAGFVALLTFATAVRWLGPSKTAAITGLTPVTATLAGIPVMGEIPTPVQLVACLGIVLGVGLVTGAIGGRRTG
ncbi:DMT family transporter [Sinirhodobacter populi]|uniref:DMT family transporter n=2 Tax=Paenirhodobacter populi TaxID=2306993 RepID=A0A443JT93_9RHOB|nr:DMT family transporter [Sinirhodobacter populi]